MLFAITWRNLATLGAVNVAVRDGYFGAIISSAIRFAKFLGRPIALGVAASKTIEQRRIAGLNAYCPAGIHALRIGLESATACAGRLELQRRALGGAAAFDFNFAVDTIGEIKVAAVLRTGGLSRRRRDKQE